VKHLVKPINKHPNEVLHFAIFFHRMLGTALKDHLKTSTIAKLEHTTKLFFFAESAGFKMMKIVR
jgi:hypothetical protein